MDVKIKRGQILKDLRKNYKDAKLNQADVANIIGVSVQAYQKYEYGTAEPTFDAISKLADFYNVSVDYLLGRETNKQIDYIQQLADEKGLDSSQRGILAAFCYMDDAGREKLLDSIEKIHNYKKKPPGAGADGKAVYHARNARRPDGGSSENERRSIVLTRILRK